MKHDGTSYAIDIIDEIISTCVKEVLTINPLKEYLGELTNDNEEIGKNI